MSKEMREQALMPSTIKSYQRGFSQAEWPLDSPFRIMAYLNKAPSSDASLKQWMATAGKIHRSRLWPEPDFKHPLVQNFIDAIKHRSSKTKSHFENKATFTSEELAAIFDCLKANKQPTDKRNWAILVTQLFGVRRASEVLKLEAKDIKILDGTFVVKVASSKSDRRKEGIFFKLPKKSIFGFDPSEVLANYILSTRGKGKIVFQGFNPRAKKFTQEGITINGWNRALRRLCTRAKVTPKTSHAIRRSAITLSPIELVEAVAQTGGWKSLCFWEVYRKFDIHQRAEAVARIGCVERLTSNKAIILR